MLFANDGGQMITVKDLIEKLSNLDPELPIILSEDSEGNSYNYLRVIDDNTMFLYNDNEIKLHHLTPELKAHRYSEEDVFNPEEDDGVRCVVFWP
jgi:hypothetical protein